MDNISDILSSVLSDPAAVAKLRETAQQLGLGGQPDNSVPAQTSPPPSDSGASAVSDLSSSLLPALGKLAPVLGKLNEEDDMTRLIHALRPYLTGTRLKRAEEADKLVAIMRVIPLLKGQQL